MADVASNAVLNRTVTYENGDTATATDTHTALVALELGSLLDVTLGSSDHPLVEFSLTDDTNSVEIDLSISGLLGVGVLDQYTVILEQFVGGAWVRPTDTGNSISDGILDLDLLGLLGTSGSLTLENLSAGDYRATLVKNPGISLGIGATREITVTATDIVEVENVSVGSNAEGNFISEAASGDLGGLEVASVIFNGVETEVAGVTTIDGEFGTLTIDGSGAYSYTPATTSAAGSVDSFQIAIVDAIDGYELSSNLNITVNVEDVGAPAAFMAFSLDPLDEGGGDVDLDALGVPKDEDAPIVPETGSESLDPQNYADPFTLDDDLESQI